jgi:hypothetical protein
MTTRSYRPYGGHDELTRSDAPAEPLISAVRGGASLVLQQRHAAGPLHTPPGHLMTDAGHFPVNPEERPK